MKKKWMAICDSEKEYVERILNYAGKHGQIPVSVQIFTDTNELLNFLDKTPVSIVLITAEMMTEEVVRKQVELCVLLGDGEVSDSRKPYPHISKYQSCDRLFAQVMRLYADQSYSDYIGPMQNRSFSVRGIYSPVSGTGKTLFAMKLGQELAREKKVLYLNLEGYSGFDSLLPKISEEDLSDLFYYLEQKESSFSCRLNGMVQSFWGMDYVRPAQSPSDLREITREDMQTLINRIANGTMYEELILDISDLADGLFPLLRACKRIYTPVRTDEIANAKRRQYEGELLRQGYRDVLDRTRFLFLPEVKDRGIRFSQAQWDPLTALVRRLLKEEAK